MANVCGWMPAGIMLALFMLSGCTQPTGTDQGSTLKEGDPVGLLSIRPSVAMEGCDVIVLGAEIPAGWAEPYLVDGFELSTAEIGIAAVTLLFRECDRFILHNKSYGRVHLLEVRLHVVQSVDDEWPKTTRLVPFAYTDSVAVARFFDPQGSRYHVASVRADPVDAGVGTGLGQWEFSNTSYAFSFPAVQTEIGDVVTSSEFAQWLALSPPIPVNVSSTQHYTGMDLRATEIRFEGETPLRSLLNGAPAWPFDSSFFWNGKIRYQL